MCSVGCAKVILFSFNFVFWLAGGGVFGIGLWMKLDETIVNYLEVVNIDQSDDLISHAAWLFIVVGAFVFVVGFLGCCGALRGSQCLLFLYALLVLVVMAAEIVAAVLALIYKQRVENHLRESMERQVKEEYGKNTATGAAWDFLQTRLKCCGGDSLEDYRNSEWFNNTRVNSTGMYVPATCCKLANDDPQHPMPIDMTLCQTDAMDKREGSAYVNNAGCYESLHNWFTRQSLILMIIGFAVGAIQVIGFVTACCLRSALKRDQSYSG